MTSYLSKGLRVLPIALSAVLGLAQPASAEGSWQVRADFLAIDDGHYNGRYDLGDIQAFTFIGHDNSLGLSLERRISDRFGLELTAFSIKPDFVLAIADSSGGGARGFIDTLDIFTMTLGLAVHLTPGHRLDVYVQPLAGMMNVEDLTFTDGLDTLNLPTKDEVVLGLALGVDVRIKDSAWSFNANLRYLDLGFDATAEDGAKFDIGYEPIVAGLGVGFRF